MTSLTCSVSAIDPPLNFHAPLYEVIKDNLKEWAVGAGSFVVVGLLETEGFGEKAELMQALNAFPSDICAAADGGNKGSKVILEKLK
jgi:pumilio family protein 6